MSTTLLFALVACIALLTTIEARNYPENSDKRSYPEEIHGDARIYVWHHFLSDEECDFIRNKAEKRLSRSGVVDTASGSSVISDIRTSDGMFFNRAEDAIIESIERRIAAWTLTPVHNAEGFQVLRYKKEQKYDAHWDYFFNKEGTENGGNRYSTVLTYLAVPEEGGETVFPRIPAPNGINPGFSECAKYSLAVKPKKGDAILFHSEKVGSPDLEERSMHTACPVVRGEKWSMAKWIHSGQYKMGDKYDEEVSQQRRRETEFVRAGTDRVGEL